MILDTPIKKGLIRIGRGGSVGLQDNGKTSLIIKPGGVLKLSGNINISEGSSVRVDENAELVIGNNFYCNKNCRISVRKKISIGENCLIGWNVRINDCDGHYIFSTDGDIKPYQKDIVISDHVWLASDVIVQKGVFIAEDCVVAQGSLVNGSFYAKKHLIGGFPAKIIKEIGGWQR